MCPPSDSIYKIITRYGTAHRIQPVFIEICPVMKVLIAYVTDGRTELPMNERTP